MAAIVVAVIGQKVSAALIGISIISIPLYVVGVLSGLVGIYTVTKMAVEPGDVASLRRDAARALRTGDKSRAAALERDADELEAVFQGQQATGTDPS